MARINKTSRRTFLREVTGGVMVPALAIGGAGAGRSRQPGETFRSVWLLVDSTPARVTRTWLGPAFWANRLQDWRAHDGRLECLAGQSADLGRTVAVLTREIRPGGGSAHFSVRTGTLEVNGRGGFSGFLIGVGGGRLDYRAAALAQKASGEAGGFWCGYDSDGEVRFREHTSEAAPLAYGLMDAESIGDTHPRRRSVREDVELRLDIEPQADGRFVVRMAARDAETGTLLSAAARRDVAEDDIVGSMAIASSPLPRGRARFWLRDLRSAGEKVSVQPERALGPIIATLYSVNQRVMKLSVQLAPLGEDEPREVTFQYREPGGAWRIGPRSAWEAGYTALVRIDDWDSSRRWEYRVTYRDEAGDEHQHDGVLQADPRGEDEFTIAHLSCVMPTARGLEGGVGEPELPVAELLGRYTDKNIHFPHAELTTHMARHQPHLLVCAGDQLYEGNPTRRDNSESPTLDYLYKWYLWLLAFRDLTRTTPTVVQTDDHDVYHGNLWGNAGRAAPMKIVDEVGRAVRVRDQNRGGYRCSAEFINLVQRTQCGHNPDPYDPTPVEQGIGVYYGSFKFGGIGFAILEDRKFKTAPIQGADLDVHEAELLGARQEAFLEAWGRDNDGVEGRICLTQTIFACLQTSPGGRPLLDWDANGQPKLQRDRAIELLREAGALVLAGDQHLASIVRHGVDSHTDGVMQYTGPAGVSFWQRWFEPRTPLPNAGDRPNTGDFTDAFGNKLRVFAVANPKVTFDYYRQFKAGRSQALGDKRLKSEGYGIVRVRRAAREYRIECWPGGVDPSQPGAEQFPGWPYRLRFDECDGRAL